MTNDFNKKFMLSPTQPNWEAIYKELNTNGIENLQELPVGILQQMNELSNRPLGPINGDSQVDRNWLENTTIEEVVTKARSEQRIYNDITLKEPPKPSDLLETFQQSNEKNKLTGAESTKKVQEELQPLPASISTIESSNQIDTTPKSVYEQALLNQELDYLHERLPEVKKKEAEIKAREEAEAKAFREQQQKIDADLQKRRNDVLEKVKERRDQAVNYSKQTTGNGEVYGPPEMQGPRSP